MLANEIDEFYKLTGTTRRPLIDATLHLGAAIAFSSLVNICSAKNIPNPSAAMIEHHNALAKYLEEQTGWQFMDENEENPFVSASRLSSGMVGHDMSFYAGLLISGMVALYKALLVALDKDGSPEEDAVWGTVVNRLAQFTAQAFLDVFVEGSETEANQLLSKFAALPIDELLASS